jgi:dienelactone hydrolase
MKSAVDLVALDGHGCKNGYYGRQCERQFCAGYLRGDDGAGIVAPIVVLGFCWGGEDPFISAVEDSLGRSQAAFLGRTDETKFDDAERIYLPVLRILAELGPSPDPASAHARLASIAPSIGPAWRTELLPRRNDS